MDNKLQENLTKLRRLENNYFKKFNEYYPGYVSPEKEGVFGPSELYEMAIEAQVLLTSLGVTAVKRLNYLGFDLLFPFNNPVDWYNWKELVEKNKIYNTMYFSISTRIATEFERMEQHIKNGTWESYCNLSESEFSVPKEQYLSLFINNVDRAESNNSLEKTDDKNHGAQINIDTFTYNEQREEQAIKTLDGLHKTTGIWSNVANVLSSVLKMTGMKI
ncbi:MAG TPA: hypothetical protein ENK06_02035 [Gammaproteobacteria bacterium]|nr:hypothetical protein [Gammaproteobacteria bacterium]